MGVAATRREGCWNTDNQTLARCELFGKVDFVAWAVLEQVDIWDRVSNFDLSNSQYWYNVAYYTAPRRTMFAVVVVKSLLLYNIGSVDLLTLQSCDGCNSRRKLGERRKHFVYMTRGVNKWILIGFCLR